MKNIEKFHHTVNILVQAFLNDELAHGTCGACAVGNIVAAANGTKPLPDTTCLRGFSMTQFSNGRSIRWGHAFMTGSDGEQLFYKPDKGTWYHILAEVKPTGYTWQQLAMIEKAFESAPGYDSEDYQNEAWMFNGLMAVVSVLAEIHNIDLTVKESAKSLFVKALKE